MRSCLFGWRIRGAFTSGDMSFQGYLSDQAASLAENYQRTGVMKDLNEAIRIIEQAINMTSTGHPHLVAMLQKLGFMLGLRYERTGNMGDLNRAVEAADMAVTATPGDHPDQAALLNNLGAWLGRRFERTRVIDDLNRAVEVADMAVVATPPDHPDRARRLSNLGIWLGRRFEQTRAMDDLNRAVEVADMAVAITPPDHPDRAVCLNNLGNRLGRRFERTGAMDDLNRAVDVADMAVAATPTDHPDRVGWLNNLGAWLGKRFERTGVMDDLNRAVKIADMAMAATSPGHPDRAACLNNLGSLLSRRFKWTGAMGDLNRAVEVADMAVAATPSNHPDRAGYLSNLGTQLGTRFEQTAVMDDLNRAVEVADMAVAATPPDHPNRAACLNNLGAWLGRRFEQSEAMDDLNRAVEIADMAMAVTPPDHPDRATCLDNLGIWLGRRFERTGMGDLNRAVEVADMAVAATPPDHPDRARRLSNLGIWLGRRFERTGAMNDLNHAVEVADMAVTATPPGHPDRAGYLGNLGVWLGRQFERTRVIDGLNRAVEVTDMAVAATPPGHPDRDRRLSNLGIWLGRRFERTGVIEDLNRAVEVADMAVAATPLDHPDRARRLGNLGALLGRRFERFEQTGAMDDLNRAVEVTGMAVAATPPDHPDRTSWLNNLGAWLGKRFELTGGRKDIEQALLSYKEGWNCQDAGPSIRIKLARSAAMLLASQSNWEESSDLLQRAVELLPTVSPRFLQHTDKQHMLGEFVGLASMATATALNAGKEGHSVLKLLELGRGVIASLLLETRTDISTLKHLHPELAAEFVSLRDELDSPTDATALPISNGDARSWESQAKRRREADRRFKEVILRIRAQPGFQDFLLPSTADELMAAADPDPIIIVNVSSYRCDAFLIERHQIRVLELPKLCLKEAEEKARYLKSSGITSPILEWLWDAVACPILEALDFQQPPSDDNWPHIWWVLTGALTHLPLHAAGRHTKGSTETVLDRVMSSYSLSVRTLIYGRRHSVQKSAEPASEHALLVAMRETPGLSVNSVLPFATDEVAMLNDLCPSMQLKPVKPSQQHKKDILSHLRACKIFHFAGHGQSNPLEPSRSCLLLEDWKDNPLTVEDLRDHRLQENSPFLGYLSACSTGINKADRFIDEGIHLVSACQLAGFRHVIGTLWEVSDKHCVDVARVFYETIRDEGMTDVALYRGLHRAVRALRDGRVEMRKVTGESSTTGKTAGHHSGTEAAKVDDNRIEATQKDGKDSLPDTTKAGDGAPATVTQTDSRSTCGKEETEVVSDRNKEDAKASGRNSRGGVSRSEDDGIQLERDAKLCGNQTGQESPLYWAPYIHFGV